MARREDLLAFTTVPGTPRLRSYLSANAITPRSPRGIDARTGDAQERAWLPQRLIFLAHAPRMPA